MTRTLSATSMVALESGKELKVHPSKNFAATLCNLESGKELKDYYPQCWINVFLLFWNPERN